jgi:ABC-type multidrug transport system ATPase subunit
VSPHGALYTSLASSIANFSGLVRNIPRTEVCIPVVLFKSALYLVATYYLDVQSVRYVEPLPVDPKFDPACLEGLDEDVLAERERTAVQTEPIPLKVERLRKVFPPKLAGRKSVVATQDVSFTVSSGEIFGLLGANGAGKTTTLSMLTRHLVPTSGDAFVAAQSILTSFPKAATHMGVVTQNNSLWDRLSVQDHLYLFARLRGVPEDLVRNVVDGTIDQLELTPHRHKLSMRLSGGMKRKLCVAIALIGDPDLVLLDEPSAGLDPVSRRNLWSVILRTMSHRAVILTTHSMEEAEALCKRIGIMVQGQLRALGTKQHLKNKFGSGFELQVKLMVKDFEKQLEELGGFVRGMFPSATMISENGGLITYQIPREEMKMGLAFTELENNKARLCIEDYSVAQPTLEQVRGTYLAHIPALRYYSVLTHSSYYDNAGVHSHGEQAHRDHEGVQRAATGRGNRCGGRGGSIPRNQSLRLHAVHHASDDLCGGRSDGAVLGAGRGHAVLWAVLHPRRAESDRGGAGHLPGVLCLLPSRCGRGRVGHLGHTAKQDERRDNGKKHRGNCVFAWCDVYCIYERTLSASQREECSS